MNQPVCLIIGAGPGMGRAVAERFAREGFFLVLLDKNAAALAANQQVLEEHGWPVATYQADAGQPDQLRGVLARAHQQHGPVAVLVYNAVHYQTDATSAVLPADFEAIYSVNVLGGLVAAQQVLPAMRAAGRGTLLFTGGNYAIRPHHQFTTLSFGKAGIRLLATLLNEELADTDIKVGTVTICGWLVAGTHFDPARVAECFWTLHQQDKQAQAVEVMYD